VSPAVAQLPLSVHPQWVMPKIAKRQMLYLPWGTAAYLGA
jgi:hypothetical protein